MLLHNILLAYQLEGYNAKRFIKFIYTHPTFWIVGSKRQVLDWTSKARLIFGLTLIFIILDISASIYFLSGILIYLNIVSIIFLIPFYFVIAHILVSPLDIYLKKRIITKAKDKISQFKNLTVIAITGSYGKTTTKEILKTILSENFKVLATEGTKNTPLGISRLILSELQTHHEVLIVEMGAYTKGNIAELCDIVKPSISILTGITLQHLERFQSLESIIDTKFEILESLGKDDFAVVDTSTIGVQKGLKEKKLTLQNISQVNSNIPLTYKENLEGIIFDFHGEKIETKLLSNYIGNTLQICYEVGKFLGQDIRSFKKGVSKIDFVEHRMQLIYNPQSNIYVLDDSFNGNIEGINSIIDLLKNAPFTGRKILVAGGIVELGEKTLEVHKKLSQDIAKVSDMVFLVDGPVGNALEVGLLENKYPKDNIKKYPSALALHKDIGNILQSGDLIVFQNDLPDHYL